MTLGRLENCPECDHAGGLPLNTTDGHIIRMQCPNCNCMYEMTTTKLTRQKHE